MSKKRVKSFYKFVFFIIAIVILSFISLAFIEYYSTTGYIEVNVIKVFEDTIVVGNNCTAIIAQTSPENAHSIQLGLEKKIEERPNAHDTIVSILKTFNITLDTVQISKFDDKYYYSDMYLRQGDKVLKLDAMPSDAIAIALRTGAKIYINQTLLEQIGNYIC